VWGEKKNVKVQSKAAAEATALIASTIRVLPHADWGAVLLQGSPIDCQALPDLDEFLAPPVDVLTESGDAVAEDHQGRWAEEARVLGFYRPIRSPGILTLCARSLQQFFWCLLCRIDARYPDAFIIDRDLQALATLVVYKTYWHELFHFSADVLRQLLGSPYDALREEALAVAYAYLQLEHPDGRSTLGQINPVVHLTALDLAFRYRSPGYKDWHQFNSLSSFKQGLVDYFRPTPALAPAGVPVADMLYAMLGWQNGGYVERVI
jgi:hypothetical protein